MENNTISKFQEAYKKYIGDFSFMSLLNLGLTSIVIAVVPFFTGGFDFAIFTAFSFWIITAFKIFLNQKTRKTMLEHTIDMGFLRDEDIKETHTEIAKHRATIDKDRLSKYLPKAVREENLKNKLNDLYDYIDVLLNKSKDDSEILTLTQVLEDVQDYLEGIETNKTHEELKPLRTKLAKELAKVKTRTLTVSSLFNKHDSTKKGKEIGLDIDKAVKLSMRNSVTTSVLIVVALNAVAFAPKDFSSGDLIQALLNMVILVWNGTSGVISGKGIIKKYLSVAIYKLEFLKSFINKAEHYTKPSEEDLEKQRIKDEVDEERRLQKELEKETRDYTREIESETRRLTHEAKMAEIKTQGEVARAKILEANKPQEQQTIKLEVVNKEAK
jgi:hypothetical protein